MSNAWVIVHGETGDYLKLGFADGKPVMRAVWTEDPRDADTYSNWLIAAETRDQLNLRNVAFVRRKGDV